MDEKSLSVYLAIGQLILQYGLPMALNLLKSLQIDNPTAADILALRSRVPHPDSYEEG